MDEKTRQALELEREFGARRCNGGPNGTGWCGKRATVVCTEPSSRAHPSQWYACDDVSHQEGAATMPIAEWFKFVRRRIVAEP